MKIKSIFEDGILVDFIYLLFTHVMVNSERVPTGSPSRGGEVAVYVFDINQPSSPTPFCFVLVSIAVFMAFQLYFIP